MPANIADEKSELVERTMLKELSVNGRKSIGAIARKLKMPKATTYQIYNKLVEKYDIHFVPELNLEEAWRVELLQAFKRKGTKREMREEVLDKVPAIGFQEYIVFIIFNQKEPSDKEIMDALGTSTVPQYLSRVQGGKYNLLMYAVSRTYSELQEFIISFSKILKKYSITINVTKTIIDLGSFPIKNELIQRINAPTNQKTLLLEYNENGRVEVSKVANKLKKDSAIVTYANNLISRSGLLRRITYYEGKPKYSVNVAIQIKIINESLFLETRAKWALDMINDYKDKHNEYVIICDIANPIGMLLILNHPTVEASQELLDKLKLHLKGVEFEYMVLTKALLGNLGIRDFDMRYSTQHQALELRKMVPKFVQEKSDEGTNDEELGKSFSESE